MIFKYLNLIIFLVVFSCSILTADESILSAINPSSEIEYSIRLKNGDIITGYIVEMVNDPKEGVGIKFKTELGKAIIFENQIVELIPNNSYYRHNHRIFLLPTARPIGDNYFVGMFEMLFLYAGGGIGDWLSLTAGRSVVPAIRSDQQASVMDAKFTFYSDNFDPVAKNLSFAVGGNLSFLNDNNRLIHFYGVASVELSRTSLTGSIFYKAGDEDYFILRASQTDIGVPYENGSFGIALGLDSQLPKWHDIHIIGEIWNSNIAKPTNSGGLLGFRLCNTQFSADFGLALFTQPFVIPFTSFVWTPF